jgi:hypothetical protein
VIFALSFVRATLALPAGCGTDATVPQVAPDIAADDRPSDAGAGDSALDVAPCVLAIADVAAADPCTYLGRRLFVCPTDGAMPNPIPQACTRGGSNPPENALCCE